MIDGNSAGVGEDTLNRIKKGAFLTVKSGNGVNTMTIGWAAFGFVWNPVAGAWTFRRGSADDPARVVETVIVSSNEYENTIIEERRVAGADGALLRRIREEGVHTAIDTAGAVPWSAFENERNPG